MKPKATTAPETSDNMTTFFESSSSNAPSDVESGYPVDELPPPPAIHFVGPTSRHRRDSSMVSSATVQIGLRLSHAMDEDTPTIPPQTQRPVSSHLLVQTIPLSSPKRPTSIPSKAAELLSPPAGSGECKNKKLPPVPRDSGSPKLKPVVSKLSAAVYSPASTKRTIPSSPLKTVTPMRPEPARPQASKADWI